MMMRGAALVIGSLLWEDNYQGKDLRRSVWRENWLKMDARVKVSLPIHYGRYSAKRKCCTTTFFPEDELKGRAMGVGYAIPFKVKFTKISELESAGIAMARAEGMESRQLRTDWMTTAIVANPEFKDRDRIEIAWSRLVKKKTDKLSDGNDEHFGFDPNGYLRTGWPKEAGSGQFLKDLDLVIAVATVPRELDRRQIAPTTEEVAWSMNGPKGREYFSKNQQNGILTYQDEAIARFIAEHEPANPPSSPDSDLAP
jgi:hypothetical protein